MKYFCITFLMLIALFVFAKGQSANRRVSLLVKNCKAGEDVCDTQDLVRYNFENGEFVSKNNILTLPTNRVRYDLGANTIYQNRYVITEWGDIIDIQAKQLLHEGKGKFIGAEGSLIFHKVNKTDVEGYFVFDLLTRKYTHIKSAGKWSLERNLSPDRTKTAHYNFITRKLEINEVGKKDTKIKVGLSAEGNTRCSSFLSLPLIWLDNQRILSQKTNGELVVLDLKGKITSLLKIDVDKEQTCPPYFRRDDVGNIIYFTDGGNYLIDVDAKAYKRNLWQYGNGFESYSDGSWKTYYFGGKEIGQFCTLGSNAINGHIAVVYENNDANSPNGKCSILWNPKGVKVWNEIKKDWITIEIDWGAKIIGWIED